MPIGGGGFKPTKRNDGSKLGVIANPITPQSPSPNPSSAASISAGGGVRPNTHKLLAPGVVVSPPASPQEIRGARVMPPQSPSTVSDPAPTFSVPAISTSSRVLGPILNPKSHSYQATLVSLHGVRPPSFDAPRRPPLRMDPKNPIKVSAVLSIHNRSKLFKRALEGYLWQTLPPQEWEILLLDDMSTEDLRQTYEHLIGKINIRHIRMDHTRHPVFKKRNPGWRRGDHENWYHTPAITMNAGFARAKGEVICLCHPEILHAPRNFETAVRMLTQQASFLFGTTYLGTQETNSWLDARPWSSLGWDGFLAGCGAANLQKYGYECYWYTSFLPREGAHAIGGVDFEYLNGAAGEDDDFRNRMAMAGWAPLHVEAIQGFHQDHSHEREIHRRRDTSHWDAGLAANRKVYTSRRDSGSYPYPANVGMDWAAKDCVVEETIYGLR